jgi:4-diphosphocytidyl-2-C-methyl-D-erythritol kinase
MHALFDVPAPAKLNLFLHVTGRRADGYHLLQSVFMLIDWHDTLHFETRMDGQISREDIGAALPADDLIVRAARALKVFAPASAGAHIVVEKRIPSQAGMGGGSSDAASCLLALNRLWKLNLPLSLLLAIGLKLGADVPFFLHGRNAWVEGIGECIQPIDLPSARFMVIKIPQGLDTKAIFSHPALTRDSETATISGFAADPFGFGRNDLQALAQDLCPGVTNALRWLRDRGLQGRMTGSGSAVFAPMREDTNPANTSAEWRDAPDDWQLRECMNLGAHPLVGWALSDDSSVGSE